MCGAIDSGHTSAHLTMVTDARLGELVQRFGRPAAQAVWDAGLGAVVQIEAICVECDIDCSFERIAGYLHLPHGTPPGESVTVFQDEARLASEMGFDAVFVEAVPFVGGPGVRFGIRRACIRLIPLRPDGAIKCAADTCSKTVRPASSRTIHWA